MKTNQVWKSLLTILSKKIEDSFYSKWSIYEWKTNSYKENNLKAGKESVDFMPAGNLTESNNLRMRSIVKMLSFLLLIR